MNSKLQQLPEPWDYVMYLITLGKHGGQIYIADKSARDEHELAALIV